ncbi:MAG: hypothetical protein WCO00_12260 [Rhodospirillaceae bacterium]
MKARFPGSIVVCAVVLAVAASLWTGQPAAAQTGAAQPTMLRQVNAHHPFPTRAVWPHEVMTYEERYDTWQKMRDAATPAERYAIWAKKRADLESRAAEHGMILRDHAPMMVAREDRYGAYAPYNGHAPMTATAPYGQPYAQPYHQQQRALAPERPAPAPGWVGPHYFGVVPHMMPPVGR